MNSLELIFFILERYKNNNVNTVIPMMEPLLVSKIDNNGMVYNKYLNCFDIKYESREMKIQGNSAKAIISGFIIILAPNKGGKQFNIERASNISVFL